MNNSMPSQYDFEIQAPTYTTWYQFLSDNLIYFKRFHDKGSEGGERDVFPHVWTISYGILENDLAHLFHRGERYTLKGESLVFFPPFSLIEWHLSPGLIEFDSFFGQTRLPLYDVMGDLHPIFLQVEDLDRELQEQIRHIFCCRDLRRKNTYLEVDLFELISRLLLSSKGKEVSAYRELHIVAEKVKQMIDDHFQEEIKIGEIADLLELDFSYMTRVFKGVYHLTPVEYRKQLRLYDSMFKMLFEKCPVTRAGLEAGFKDLGHYYSYFKKQMNAHPSQFIPPKTRRHLNTTS